MKRTREEEVLDRLEDAIKTYKKVNEKRLAPNDEFIICYGICGFYLVKDRYRIVTHADIGGGDEEPKPPLPINVQRDIRGDAGIFSEAIFPTYFDCYPVIYCLVGRREADFSTPEKGVLSRNFTAKAMIVPKGWTKAEGAPMFNPTYAFGHYQGVLTQIPAWVVVVNSVENNVTSKSRRITFAYDNSTYTLSQYAVKQYDEQTINEGEEYLLMGVKEKSGALGNGSCCQLISSSRWKKIGGSESLWKHLNTIVKLDNTNETL